MKKINIVLHEPEIPQNTGNIARTCAATGAALHIIKPMGFTIDDKKLKRAGLDYWDKLDITYYENYEDFITKCEDAKDNIFYFTTKAPKHYCDVSNYPDNVYIMFGKETKGLPEELLLKNPDRCLRFPMQTGIRSLNLANTVCAAVYEVLRQWDFPTLQNYGQLHNYKWPE
jgi:tRNA (cytidine/uridine-2'-O-)-methyltransferase